MKTPEHLMAIPRQRRIEWWAILNAHRTPEDLPKSDKAESQNEEPLFHWLEQTLSKKERMEFWNGDFEHGRNVDRFL